MIANDLLPTAAEMAEYVELMGQCVFAGVGISLAFWAMGYAVWFLIDVLRGGV